MATYLALCQKVQRILRTDTGKVGTTPTTVVGQEGPLLEIVEWVQDAYQEIQAEQRDWLFRRARGTLALSASTRTYSKSTIQGSLSTYDEILPFKFDWSGQRFIKVYTTSVGVGDETFCYFYPYADWRGLYDIGTASTGKPGRFTVRPDDTLEFDPTPDAAYTAVFDYRKTLDSLSGNSDTPDIPSEHQEAIVWKAVRNYCVTRDNATETYQKAEREYRRAMNALRRAQLPEFTTAE